MSFLFGLGLGLSVLFICLMVRKFGQPTAKTNYYDPNQVVVNRSLMPSERGTLNVFETINDTPAHETAITTIVEVIEETENAPTVEEVLKTFATKQKPVETPKYEEVELDSSTLAFADMLQNSIPSFEENGFEAEESEVPMYVYENMNFEEDYDHSYPHDYSYVSSYEEQTEPVEENEAETAELNNGVDYGQLINFDRFVQNSMKLVGTNNGGSERMNINQIAIEEKSQLEKDSFIARVTDLSGIKQMPDISVAEEPIKIEPVTLTTDDWHDSTNVDSQFIKVARFYEDEIEDRLIDGTNGFRSWVVQVVGVHKNLLHVTDGTARIWLDIENFSTRNFEKKDIYLIEATDGEVMTLSILNHRENSPSITTYNMDEFYYEEELRESLKLA